MLDTRVITSCTSEVFKLVFKIPLLIVLRWLHDLVMHLITYTQKLIEYNTVTKHFALFSWKSTFDKVVSVMHLHTHDLSLRWNQNNLKDLVWLTNIYWFLIYYFCYICDKLHFVTFFKVSNSIGFRTVLTEILNQS